MPRVEREANVVWKGSSARGRGALTGASSGAFAGLPYSEPARVGTPDGQTSPEELLAAAHAACYCMQLSHELAEAGTPPERLEATATVDFEPGEGVLSSHVVVRGRVTGIDQETFGAAAASAGESCPISGALKGNLEITVEATLDA